MGKRHRRSWSVVRDGEVGATSGYRASLVKVESETAFLALLNLFSLPEAIHRSEPRYRVLVAKDGSEGSVGVADARTYSDALREFFRVDQFVASRSSEQVRAEFDLDS